jgi:CBS domain-containing protein
MPTDSGLTAYNSRTIPELTLEELFPTTMTDTPCVNVSSERDVWVATLMCAQYLESAIDSIVVRDDDFKPIGIIGGYDLLDHIRKYPTRDFQYQTKVKEIMLKDFARAEKKTKIKDLIEAWKKSLRAFAIVPNEFGDYSVISARKMIEVGTRCETDISISSMPKKKIFTFHGDESIDKVLAIMYENKTRKLLLQNSNQFISDRMILGEISRVLHFRDGVENLLEMSVSTVNLEYARKVEKDLNFNELCAIMEKMEHPYIIYNDTVVTPWDVCLTLMSENATISFKKEYHREKQICPTCGKPLD